MDQPVAVQHMRVLLRVRFVPGTICNPEQRAVFGTQDSLVLFANVQAPHCSCGFTAN